MKRRVLIVDDSPTNLSMLEELLTGEGFEVTSAVDGRDALEKAVLDPPDLIVTDVLMPVMDGFVLCKQWKSDDKLKHIPFVIYTATYSGRDNETFALSLGADRFILKPQEPDVLLSLLEEVLEESYQARQVEAKPLEEEIVFFKQYNEILFRKLEKKMSDLETANRKLKSLAERYRLFFENVSDVIYVIDADLKILAMAPSVERILGYKPSEFIGRPVADLADVFSPGFLEQAIEDISLVLKGKSISSKMYEFIAKDGSKRIGEVSSSPIMQDGKVGSMIGVARDITDRKQAQDKLKDSERLYRELYDFLPIPAYEMDFESNLTFVNRAIYEVFRGTEEDFKKGFKAWQLLSDDDVEKSRRNMERLLRGERVVGTEYTLTRLDGSVFPAIVVSSIIYRDGKPVGLRGAIIDITERKRAEDELRKSEEKYRLLFNNASEAILVVQGGVVKFANPANFALSGYSEEELSAKPFGEFIHPEDREMVYEYYRKRIGGEEVPANHAFRIKTQDGSVKWVAIHAALVDWEGQAATLNFLNDITEHRRAGEALRESEEKFRSLFEHSLDAIFLTGPDGSIIEANQAACEMFGRSVDEFRAVGRAGLVDGTDPRLKAALEERTRTGKARAELTMTRADGERFTAEVTSTIFTDMNGEQKTSMIIHDISDRKKAEKALQESEKRYRSVFEDHAAVKFLIDPDTGNIIEANAAAENYYGWSREQLKQMKIQELNTLRPEDVKRNMDRGLLDKQVHFEFRHRRADGSIRDVEVFSSKIDLKGKPLLHSIVHDITDRKKAEEALEAEHALLRNLIDNVPDRIYAKDRESRFIVCNEAMVRRMGLTSMNEIVGKSDFELLPREMAERFRADDLSVIQSGIPIINREEPLAIEGGKTTRWNLATKVPLLDRNGNRVGVVGLGREITDLKLAEEALRKSEARFRSYFELPLIGIAVTSPEKGWLEVNDRLLEILGYSWQELKGMTWAELTYPEDLAADVRQFNRILAGEINSYMIDKRFVRKNGKVIWTSLAGGCVRRQDGAVDYLVALLEDITERKESVERLRKTLGATVQAMAATVETRDPYTAGHQHRVADLARSIAAEMRLSPERIDGVRMAAMVHDIGKLSVPAELLSMPRKLTDIELKLIKTHAESGYNILKDIEFPWPIARMVLEHHERMDGSGYPRGLTGDRILIESRILSVADVIEAMASHRPYRPGLGLNDALDEIFRHRGTRYDADVVDACVRLFRGKNYRIVV